MMLNTNQINKRDLGIDILRIVAILGIIIQHSSGGFLIYNAFNNGGHWWIQGVIYGGFFRWSSAVFVMISGVYMLKANKSENIKSFLISRFKRIIIPFIAWVFIYKLISDPNAIIESNGKVILSYLVDIVSGNVEYHLWFVYMLSILYLLTPLFSYFVNNAPKHVIYYVLGIWFLMNFGPDVIGLTLGTGFGGDYYLEFSKFSGFYILGFALKDIKIKKAWLLLLPFVVLAIINIAGTYILSNYKMTNDYYFLGRFSPTNILNAILIFLFFNSLNWEKRIPVTKKLRKWIINLSLISYGIFLNHVFILHILRSGNYGFKIISYNFLGEDIEPWYGIMIVFIITVIGSSLLAFILSKIPIIKKLLV